MEVSGVRRSWETARKRFARIFSFSLSMRSCSCFLMRVVRVLVMMDTTSITRPENRFSDRVKLNAKYGERKAKFTASTLIRDAATPQTYPSVYMDVTNTASIKISMATPSMRLITACVSITMA